MTLRRTILSCVVALALPYAAVGAEKTRLLLPIVVNEPAPGAEGSLWTTTVTVLNTGDSNLPVTGIDPWCAVEPCAMGYLVPGRTSVRKPDVRPALSPARFLIVDSAKRDDLHVHLRVADISRQLETWGTEIPVVEESQATTRPIELLDVPAQAGFRVMLRIYDFDRGRGHVVTVRVIGEGTYTTPDVLLSSNSVELKDPPYALDAIDFPGYAEMPVTLPPQSGPVRIEIAPAAPGFRIWAFASVTHNETQHVTLVTP